MSVKVAVLGSTGSVGKQVLEVLKSSDFEVVALSAHTNEKLLIQQAKEFKVKHTALSSQKSENKKSYTEKDWYKYLIDQANPDIVIISVLGFAGLKPAYYALQKNKKLLLANKEAIVAGGELLLKLARENKQPIIPIDSEHSAIFQCLMGEQNEFIRKIYLTASGGPFLRLKREELQNITPQQAVNHPVWNMGAKISVDSATLMNKGLEAIEAYWLFQLKPQQIDFLIHPQAIVHSLVEFTDGSIKAQMGTPDMKTPIRFALSYPNRFKVPANEFRLDTIKNLHFEALDDKRFPAVNLALKALEIGGTAPCILNAANEAAVNAFLNQKIKFTDITQFVDIALKQIPHTNKMDIETLCQTHEETIKFINKKIK